MEEYSWDDVEARCVGLARLLSRRSTPGLIVGLETGGAYVAAMLKKLTGAPHMVVLDVVHEGDDYRLGGTAQLTRQLVAGKHVWGVDDGYVRGILLGELHDVVHDLGGHPTLGVISKVGDKSQIEHPVVVREHVAENPGWPWKRIPRLT